MMRLALGETVPGAVLLAVLDKLEEENARLRRTNGHLVCVVGRQSERIDLLEQLAAPLGPRGQSRLQRSPWWRRAARRAGLVA